MIWLVLLFIAGWLVLGYLAHLLTSAEWLLEFGEHGNLHWSMVAVCYLGSPVAFLLSIIRLRIAVSGYRLGQTFVQKMERFEEEFIDSAARCESEAKPRG